MGEWAQGRETISSGDTYIKTVRRRGGGGGNYATKWELYFTVTGASPSIAMCMPYPAH